MISKELIVTIENAREDFEILAQEKMAWQKEYMYAVQILEGNEYLLGIARQNPKSLRDSIVNVAAIGLSLCPAEKLAYLIPMDGKVLMWPSYIGLAKLAVSDNGILWVQAKIVHKNDKFIFNGLDNIPTHEFSPFSDRGEAVGVYCAAKTPDGAFLSEIMTIEECIAIRDRSIMWKKKPNSGPWKNDFFEMCKKTVVKKAHKLWPKGASSKLEKAIEVLNEYEGIDFSRPSKTSESSNILNKAIGQDKPSDEKKELLDKLVGICRMACKGYDDSKKIEFMINEMGVNSFKELEKNSEKEITILIEKIETKYANKKNEDIDLEEFNRSMKEQMQQ